MTIAQTIYSKFFQGAAVGALYDVSEYMDIITAQDIDPTDALGVTNPVNGVPFGAFCSVDSATPFPTRFTGQPEMDKLAKLPALATDVTNVVVALGIALRTTLIENDIAFVSPASASIYPQKWPMGIVRKGRIWVKPEAAVGVGDDVSVRWAANGGNLQRGSLTNTPDGGTAVFANGRFFRGSDANGLAVLELVN